ncbi:hypothetical protein TUM3811_05730 [Shewanella algae]|nr:hypothetical protein TUM3811_05730 [Shewanella algae]
MEQTAAHIYCAPAQVNAEFPPPGVSDKARRPLPQYDAKHSGQAAYRPYNSEDLSSPLESCQRVFLFANK